MLLLDQCDLHLCVVLSWLYRTFSVGLGAPIDEGFSLLIILVVAIGLGIPLLLVIGSIVYIAFKRLCNRHRGYAEISSSYAEIN